MKLVVLQCADHFALKRGWAHPDPHNVTTLERELAQLEAASDEDWSNFVADEMADEASIGG